MNTQVDPTKGHVYERAASAKEAWRDLRVSSVLARNKALIGAAAELRAQSRAILAANQKDVAAATEAGKDKAFLDRLLLNEARIEAMAVGLEQIAELPDPAGQTLATFERPNGLLIERVSVPIGVLGMIFESRPNVAADAGALCIKAGNAIVLRGGSDSIHSVTIIVDCLQRGLAAAGLPEAAVQAITTTDRTAVRHLLQCTDYIDLVIPRGGKSLVERVVAEAKVPTLQHLDGNCHTYIHAAADIDKAVAIVSNAKLRRTGICGATESLVIDKAVAGNVLPALLDAMPECEFRGDEAACAIDTRLKPATPADYDTEYLDAVLSVKIVEGLVDAIAFVDQHSSGHTDAIVTEDDEAAGRFLRDIDSAVVMHNASTQFADGGEFGMGAEIGIATGRLHARGPVGLEQLVTFKYRVRGSGQVRP